MIEAANWVTVAEAARKADRSPQWVRDQICLADQPVRGGSHHESGERPCGVLEKVAFRAEPSSDPRPRMMHKWTPKRLTERRPISQGLSRASSSFHKCRSPWVRSPSLRLRPVTNIKGSFIVVSWSKPLVTRQMSTRVGPQRPASAEHVPIRRLSELRNFVINPPTTSANHG